jgi:hypothetical protein
MFVPPLFFWSAVKKRAVRKLKKAGAIIKPGLKPEKVNETGRTCLGRKKALERFLGKEGIRKTQGGYYLECEDRKHC